jgi:DNA-binding MarR family transcriptional regulator
MEIPEIEQTVEESLVLSILELAGILNKRGTNVTAEMGVTTQQWVVLLYLCQDPNIPELPQKLPADHSKGWLASDLANAMNVSRPYVTNLINTLLEKGMVASLQDQHDQRKKWITLTERGANAVAQLQPHRKAANAHLFMGLGDEARAQLLAWISACLHNLREPLR